ncbi:MAG: hypothetical protein GC203_08480 [Phenylobacterium sp.]|uniref:hypothetical protein n=1 Tax=Phenylobacterium sp. TaxID=1871053 RepID=UPI0025D2813C|nr:hypothetical protein [Phenylobacterium sp.]MBI1197886.1 hypothetical protein [Phenylobacterium sp.]
MKRRGAAIVLIVALAGAAPAVAPAVAQESADPIDAILRGAAREPPTSGFYVQQTGRTPDGPPSPADLAYDDRIRASMAAAQGFQGPLDGGWTLAGAGGALYALQLADHEGVVEGSWRDLRRPPGQGASGFVEQVEAGERELTIRFGGRTAVLHAERGGWRGRLTDGSRGEAVSLHRTP